MMPSSTLSTQGAGSESTSFQGSLERLCGFWVLRNASDSRIAQCLRQRQIAEVDRRPTHYAPLAVYDEPEPATAAKEGEPITPGIIINATLTPAGDRARAHQRLHLRERHPKPFRYKLSSDLDVAIDESNPGQGPSVRSVAKRYYKYHYDILSPTWQMQARGGIYAPDRVHRLRPTRAHAARGIT